jgi:hypothetical protein
MSGLAARSLIIALAELLQYTYFLKIMEGYQWLLLFVLPIITSSIILK